MWDQAGQNIPRCDPGVVLGVQKEPRTTQRCVLLKLLIKKGRELLCIKHNGILTTNRH